MSESGRWFGNNWNDDNNTTHNNNNNNNNDLPPPEAPDEITFWDDFVAGGCAGCASVLVGHPFDTIKVRLQTGQSISYTSIRVRSLYAGMGAPLSAATAINAIVFGSYGAASKLYDDRIRVPPPDELDWEHHHDPWQKSMLCGAFAGWIQCSIICPMEHVKCRLQTGAGGYSSPLSAVRAILSHHGLARLYQGWWSTCWREVPAFGLYFSSYDYFKDRATQVLLEQDPDTTHTWLASALAGGTAGSLTWAMVYPMDVVKTRIQTSPLDTPRSELRIPYVIADLRRRHGFRYLFRGLGVTLLRAFPVNGTIFPVYEFCLTHLAATGSGANA